MKCSNCGAEVGELFLYCETCGAINLEAAADEGIVCETHSDNQPVGFCVICGRPVCSECAETQGKIILCSDPRHRDICKNWKVAYFFNFEYEAAMLRANLEQNGIESEVFTRMNPDTAGEASYPTTVTVFVPSERLNDAIQIGKLIGLDEEEENEE